MQFTAAVQVSSGTGETLAVFRPYQAYGHQWRSVSCGSRGAFHSVVAAMKSDKMMFVVMFIIKISGCVITTSMNFNEVTVKH